MIEARNWLRLTVFSFSRLNNIISSSGMPQCQDILRRVSQLICEGMFYVSLNNSVSSLPPVQCPVSHSGLFTPTLSEQLSLLPLSGRTISGEIIIFQAGVRKILSSSRFSSHLNTR